MTKLLLCCVLAMVSSSAAAQLRLAKSEAMAKLPRPMSDMSAVLGSDNLIYIAGGCDSPLGSQFDDEAGAFRCKSVSDAFYSFDPEMQEFTVLPPIPQAKYRHAAVSVNNQIWLVGGRDEFDDVVANVHVYDLGDMRWRTFRDLHGSYWLSDLEGFRARGIAYFVGGFTEDYRAVRKVWSIDPEASWDEGNLVVVRHANMVNRRGDVGVTVDSQERFAYVSGGSSHTNSFCSPLDSVEQYDLIFNHWLEIAPLNQGRTGKTVLELDGQMVAMGGGAQEMRKVCNKTNSNPFEMQTPVYEVEVYDQDEWSVVDSLADYRYRSASVVFNDTVYSFGGQSGYFDACRCHPTVDSVLTYQQSTVPQVPGEYINDYGDDFNYQMGGSVAQPALPTDLQEGQFYEPPGTDNVYLPPDGTAAEEQIEERVNTGTAEGGAEDITGESTAGTESSLGAYHREKSSAHTENASGSSVVSPTFLYTATVATIACILL